MQEVSPPLGGAPSIHIAEAKGFTARFDKSAGRTTSSSSRTSY